MKKASRRQVARHRLRLAFFLVRIGRPVALALAFLGGAIAWELAVISLIRLRGTRPNVGWQVVEDLRGFLPEPYFTVAAVVTFVGILGVVALYGPLIRRIVRTAHAAPDNRTDNEKIGFWHLCRFALSGMSGTFAMFLIAKTIWEASPIGWPGADLRYVPWLLVRCLTRLSTYTWALEGTVVLFALILPFLISGKDSVRTVRGIVLGLMFLPLFAAVAGILSAPVSWALLSVAGKTLSGSFTGTKEICNSKQLAENVFAAYGVDAIAIVLHGAFYDRLATHAPTKHAYEGYILLIPGTEFLRKRRTDVTADALAWSGFRTRQLNRLTQVIAQIDDKTPILLAGHSLGGMIAQDISQDRATSGHPIRLVTFGSPSIKYVPESQITRFRTNEDLVATSLETNAVYRNLNGSDAPIETYIMESITNTYANEMVYTTISSSSSPPSIFSSPRAWATFEINEHNSYPRRDELKDYDVLGQPRRVEAFDLATSRWTNETSKPWECFKPDRSRVIPN